ncbi:GNAT family N-acetyltransferase [Rhizobium halophytocola]|uniref:GNAT superfamily N-acetyltransferase n=1 Tax=Rhizobium halophytocola TaxID=735519 RepID=A0ABS4E1G8_9HYPH|nr:GNAT family N-acetyltransferase [Rhizobium halophytocola]MBP1851787.1 GNAT superfamily N-acetyltransferase [Rhizobium halophytocola]
MSANLAIRSFAGRDARAYFDDLARLRIAVFHDFPYLYDGDSDYERRYMEAYARSQGSIFVLAFDGDTVIGASTGTPMTAETDEVQDPFLAAGYDPATFFYFGESVLLPAYRGHGLGHRFFDLREAQAQRLGLAYCTFCAVERPLDHPRRPAGYRPLDDFWRKRGYTHHPELRTTFSWRDLDEPTESPKPLSFWIRKIA